MTKEYLSQRIEMLRRERAPLLRLDGNYKTLEGVTDKRERRKRVTRNDQIRFVRKEIFRIEEILLDLTKEYEQSFGKYQPRAPLNDEKPNQFKVIWKEHPTRSLKNFTEHEKALSYIETLRKNMPKLQFDIMPVSA